MIISPPRKRLVQDYNPWLEQTSAKLQSPAQSSIFYQAEILNKNPLRQFGNLTMNEHMQINQ